MNYHSSNLQFCEQELIHIYYVVQISTFNTNTNNDAQSYIFHLSDCKKHFLGYRTNIQMFAMLVNSISLYKFIQASRLGKMQFFSPRK